MIDITGETFPYGLTVEQMEQAAYSLELAFERAERASFDVHLDAMKAIRQLLQEKAEMAEVLSVLMKESPVYRDFSNDATCCGYCHRDIDQNSHHDECAWAIASGLLMGVDVRQDVRPKIWADCDCDHEWCKGCGCGCHYREDGKMNSEPLTQEQVDALPDGATVEVIWSGGNGPHRYRIIRDKRGHVRVDNAYRDRLEPCGTSPLTEVRLVGST
jgi:hypothetical protein